jgi:hypothetical protein
MGRHCSRSVFGAVHSQDFHVRIAGSATFLADRARRRARRGVGLAVAGAVALVGGFVLSQQFADTVVGGAGNIGVFLGLASAVLGVQQLFAASRDRQLSVGEAPVVNQLRARLSDDYYYLRRVDIPRRHAEADGILLGPAGVLVLAIRALEGRYVVRGNDWFRLLEDGGERQWNRSPTWEVARPVRALQRAMQEQGIPSVPIQGAVVLSQGQLEQASRPGAAVVPVDRIGSFVDYLRQGQPADPVAMRRLAEFLAPYAGGNARRPGDTPSQPASTASA